MDIHSIESSIEEAESSTENLLHHRNEIESKENNLDNALSSLENDLQISEILQKKHTANQQEHELIDKEINTYKSKVEFLESELSEMYSEVGNDANVLKELEAIGENVKDGFSIIDEKTKTLDIYKDRIESLKDRLGLNSNIEFNSDIAENFIQNTIQQQAKKDLEKYINEHNYGKEDFSTFSQDPVWRSLVKRANPDYSLPIITQEKAAQLLNEYMYQHSYSKKDFSTFSQDPVWRDLIENTYPEYVLPPLKVKDKDGKIYEVHELSQIKKWLPKINPDYYNPYLPSYKINCGACAIAVENYFSGNTNARASIINIGTDKMMELATHKKCVYMSPEKIADKLFEQGPGSHCIVGINRSGNQAGHWFNAYYDGNKISILDGQTGKILPWGYDYGNVTEYCALI